MRHIKKSSGNFLDLPLIQALLLYFAILIFNYSSVLLMINCSLQTKFLIELLPIFVCNLLFNSESELYICLLFVNISYTNILYRPSLTCFIVLILYFFFCSFENLYPKITPSPPYVLLYPVQS